MALVQGASQGMGLWGREEVRRAACSKGSRETLHGLGLILPRDGGRKAGPRAALEGKAEGRVVSTPSSPTRVTKL